MPDVVSPATRSRMMAGIRDKNTRQEIFIRKALHAKGYRYRLHSPYLPGKPDIVLAKHRAVIFVHGCFWHGHDCHLFKQPGTRPEFWKNKISGNRRRDERVAKETIHAGWRILTVWECAMRGRGALGPDKVVDAIASWIESRKPFMEIRGK